MSYQFPPDVAELVKQYVRSGAYLSEDDVLRDALRALGQLAHTAEEAEREYRDTVAAVREGLADIEQNREQPLRDLIDQAKAG